MTRASRRRDSASFDVDVEDATVVFAYLLPKGNAKLGAKLLRELKPGARVVTYIFKNARGDVGRETRADGEFREYARAVERGCGHVGV